MADAPGQTLLEDRRWAKGRVRSSEAAAVGAAWLGAVVLLGFSGILLARLLPETWAQGSPWSWAILASPLPGLHVLFHAVRRTLRWRRFGTTTLVLDPFPGSLGGDVGGTLQIPLGERGLPLEMGELSFRVVLSCIHTRISRRRTGSGRSKWDTVVWREEVEPRLSRGFGGLACAFAIPVPEDLPPSQPRSPSYHHWAVRVVGALAGHDFDQTFEVPVLETAEPLRAKHLEPSPAARPESAARARGAASRPPFDTERAGDGGERGLGMSAFAGLPARTVRLAPTERGLKLNYPMGREGVAACMALLFGALFGGGGVAVGRHALGPLGSWDVFGLIFGGIGGFVALAGGAFGLLLMLLGAFMLGNSLEVDLEGERVRTRRRLLGIPIATRRARLSEIESLGLEITGQMGQGAQAHVSYRIFARLAGGGTLVLGDGVRGHRVAAALAEAIAAQTGLPLQKLRRA